MSKIAVIFLLFAIVAVCNGGRFRREEPIKAESGFDLKSFAEMIKGLASDENVKKVKNTVGESLKHSGDAAIKLFSDISNKVNDNLQKVRETITAHTPK